MFHIRSILWFKAFAIQLVESAPLLLFLAIIKFVPPLKMSDWQLPYYSSSALAIVCALFMARTGRRANQCFVGIYVYLYIGSLGQIVELHQLNEALGLLAASGMMLSILVTAVAYLAFSMARLGACESGLSFDQIGPHAIFILVSALSFFLSFFSRGNVYLGEIIPFCILFFIYSRFLRQKISTSLVKS